MKRYYFLLKRVEEAIESVLFKQNGDKLYRYILNVIQDLRVTPIMQDSFKVKGMRKGYATWRYKFKKYGSQYRLFYVYDKFNIGFTHFDNRDDKTYDKKQLQILERLEKQARMWFKGGGTNEDRTNNKTN